MLYIEANNRLYSKLRNVRFDPECDFTSSVLPVNEFSFEVLSDDSFRANTYCVLHDEHGNSWARYRVTLAEDRGRGWQRVTCQSPLGLLDLVNMNPVYYDNESAVSIIGSLMVLVGSANYEVSSAFDSSMVTGYAPNQTQRQRLQWVLMAIGAHAEDCFGETVRIVPLATTTLTVPMAQTYWRPSIEYRDVVTAVKANQYSFSTATPQQGDETVKAGGTTYVVTHQQVTLANPAATSSDPENVVSVEDVMLIDSDNVDDVLTMLARRYFSREEVTLECVNDRAYKPGDKLSASVSDLDIAQGYVSSCDWTFGLHAKSRMRLVGTTMLHAAGLTVLYKYNTAIIGRYSYAFPVGVTYDVATKYVTKVMDQHRYVFRPTVSHVTGTMPEGGKVESVPCAVALDLHKRVLGVISVDSVTLVEDEYTEEGQTLVRMIAVIA
jgi:hypothetical protein